MTDATLIADLVRAGVNAELVNRVALVMSAVTFASRDESRLVTLSNRSPAAVRAARYRIKRKQNQSNAEANDAASGDAQGVTPERDASRDGVTKRCDLLSIKEVGTLDEGRKQKKKVGSENARARGTRMVAGEPLTGESIQAAIDLGAPRDRVPAMWAEFVDYWIGVPGNRGLKLNWLATWRNRVREVLSKGNRNGSRPHHSNQRQSGAADFFAGLAEVAADIGGHGAVAGEASGDIPLGRHNIDVDPTR